MMMTETKRYYVALEGCPAMDRSKIPMTFSAEEALHWIERAFDLLVFANPKLVKKMEEDEDEKSTLWT